MKMSSKKNGKKTALTNQFYNITSDNIGISVLLFSDLHFSFTPVLFCVCADGRDSSVCRDFPRPY